MKRYVILFVFASLVLLSEPYKPYPILFVHGMNANAGTWGVKVYKVGDVLTDSIKPVDSLDQTHTS